MMIMNIIKTNSTKILKGLAYGVIAVAGAVALVVVVSGKLGTEETVVEDAEMVELEELEMMEETQSEE
jgi:hypothetical protein